MAVFYRVVTDAYADLDTVEFIIETEDPSDFEDFDTAHAECVSLIEARLEEHDDEEEEDAGKAEDLQQFHSDTEGVEDWDDYLTTISQPNVYHDHMPHNVATIRGRAAVRRLIEKGVVLEEKDKVLFEKYEALSRTSAGE